ncbi:MAG: hypothetical protein FWF34_02305 [Alphaproteobacteria bacterium]|nr:hypothetical protein [Alphaproteobacteria bacterium]MCL2890062.1 hypothetical protein [Alphaproteobacteria bacterium]
MKKQTNALFKFRPLARVAPFIAGTMLLAASCGDKNNDGPNNPPEIENPVTPGNIFTTLDNAVKTLNGTNPPAKLEINLGTNRLEYNANLEKAFENLGRAIDKAEKTQVSIVGLSEIHTPQGRRLKIPVSVLKATKQNIVTRSGTITGYVFLSGGEIQITGGIPYGEIDEIAGIATGTRSGSNIAERASLVIIDKSLIDQDGIQNPITDTTSPLKHLVSQEYRIRIDTMYVVINDLTEGENRKIHSFFLGTTMASDNKKVVGMNFDRLDIMTVNDPLLRELQINGGPTVTGKTPRIAADKAPRFPEFRGDEIRFDSGGGIQNLTFSAREHKNRVRLYSRTDTVIEISSQGLGLAGNRWVLDYFKLMDFLSYIDVAPGHKIIVGAPLLVGTPGYDIGGGQIVEKRPEVYYPEFAAHNNTYEVWNAKGGPKFWRDGVTAALETVATVGVER